MFDLKKFTNQGKMCNFVAIICFCATMRRSILILTTSLALMTLVTIIIYYLLFTPCITTPIPHEVYIDNDDTKDSIFHKLEPISQNKHRSLKILWNLLDLHSHSGKYKITAEHNVVDVLRMFKNRQQVPVRLLITPTWTLERMAQRMASQLMIDTEDIMKCLHDSTTLSFMNCTFEELPAHFIPNTYEVYWNITPEQLVRRMEREYQKFWTPLRREKARKLNLSLHEVSILASIVCRETNHIPEMRTIAGLYLNRLKRNMLLQACPTVIFARNDFSTMRLTNPTHPDSPYNTYLHPGLPPGPISVPPIDAIDAVLDAEQHNYLYMCAKEDFSGAHNFAATLLEHQRNARNYQRAFKKKFANKVKS